MQGPKVTALKQPLSYAVTIVAYVYMIAAHFHDRFVDSPEAPSVLGGTAPWGPRLTDVRKRAFLNTGNYFGDFEH